MRQYPIWNNINSCAYSQKQGGSTGNKSYGIKQHGECEVRVGTSSINSNHFLDHKTTHRVLENGSHDYRFFVDGRLVKQAIYYPKTKELITFAVQIPEWDKAKLKTNTTCGGVKNADL